MMMPAISIEAARDCLRKHRASQSWTAHHYVRWTGEGDRWEEFKATEALQGLQALVRRIDRDPLPKSMGQEFEAPASAVLHEKLDLPAEIAGSRDFWLWLTFGAAEGGFVDLVDWRFGGTASSDANYGIGTLSSIREGLFARLWWRGFSGRSGYDDEACYEYARVGSVDLWRSHFIRPEIGRCREVVEAFLRAKHPTPASAAAMTVDEERALSKRLTVLNATICFELLAPAEIDSIIRKELKEIRNEGHISGVV